MHELTGTEGKKRKTQKQKAREEVGNLERRTEGRKERCPEGLTIAQDPEER